MNGNFAQVRESIQADVSASTAYNSVISVTHNLGEFPRASSVQASYKWYRLASLSFRYEVDFNVFQAGTVASAVTVPQFYWHMDRNGDNVSITDLGGMLALGCKPQKYTKNIKVHYKPNILEAITFVGTGVPPGGALTTYSPVFNRWLPTTFTSIAGGPSQVNYMGHLFYIDWPVVASVVFPNLKVITTAVWQFKEPWEIEQAPLKALADVATAGALPAKRPREEDPGETAGDSP